MIEVNSNALFLSTFGVKIDVKNERKRVSRMCENAYLSIKNPKASRALKRALGPRPQIACFARATLLRYVGNFRPQKLAPPLDQILDPHLKTVALIDVHYNISL